MQLIESLIICEIGLYKMDVQKHKLQVIRIHKTMNLKEQWQKFSEETTLHGLRNLYQSYNLGTKLIWLLVVLGMATAYIVTVSNSITAFLRYETRTTSQKVWSDGLQFPSVTFCPLNYLPKTVAEQKYPSLLKLFPQPENQELVLANQSTIQATTSIPINDINMTSSFTDGIQGNHIKLYEIIKNGILPINDTFYTCKWINSKVNCSEYIEIKLTETSICYHFPSDEIRKKSPEQFLISQVGPLLGLSVTIDINQEEDFLKLETATYSSGIKAIIHNPDKSPVAELEGINLAPGLQHDIGITQEETIRLTTPYGKSECISRSNYSYHGCLVKCLNDLRYKKCNCVATSNGTDACYIYHLFTCLDYKAESYLSSSCMCLPPCNEIVYHTKMSLLAFPSDHGYNRLKYEDNINKTIEYVKKNLLVANIYYNHMEYVYTEQKPATTFNQLIGDIGGQLGLFLGASLITIAEFIHFFITICSNFIRNKCLGPEKVSP